MQNPPTPPTHSSTHGNRHSETPTTAPHGRLDSVRQSPVGDVDTYDTGPTSHLGGGSLAIPIFIAVIGFTGLAFVVYLFLG